MSEETNRAELVEGLCSVMHDAYEAAATKAGWETQERSRKPWEDVPEANKETMRVAVSAALDALTFMGWVSPEEHYETLNDYGQAVGDLNLANHRLARIKELLPGQRVVTTYAIRAALADEGSTHLGT